MNLIEHSLCNNYITPNILKIYICSLITNTFILQTENTSIIEDVVQNNCLLESPEQVSAQNDSCAELNYKAMYFMVQGCYEETNKELKQIRIDFAKYKAKTKNIEAQYARVLKAYTELQHENQGTISKFREFRKDFEKKTQVSYFQVIYKLPCNLD